MPIDRNGGQYITANPQQPTQSSAPGIWDIDEQGSAQAAGRWPLPPNVVQRSLRFNSADSTYLNRTAVASNRTTWTWSGWVKLSAFGAYRGVFVRGDTYIYFNANNKIEINLRNAATNYFLITTPVYRDPSAWYHIVVTLDTNNGVAADRLKLYVNNVRVEQYDMSTYQSISAGYEPLINSAAIHYIGGSGTGDFNGYMAEVNFIDGQALTPSSFGQTDAQTGQWIPRVYSGSYGTNGFRLQFLDNSGTTATTLGKDTSGMGNNWTPNNFSVAAGSGNDSLRDVPMNYYSPDNGLGGEVIGNYCTFSPINSSTSPLNGNLDVSAVSCAFGATMGFSSGKWYFEFTKNANGDNQLGIVTGTAISATGGGTLMFRRMWRDGSGSPTWVSDNATAGAGTPVSASVGDVIAIALDMDNNAVYFAKNNVWMNGGVPTSGSAKSGAIWTDLGSYSNWGVYAGAASTGVYASLNCGQRPFAYTAPSGFKALCTQNLSAPRIGNVAVAQANDYFNTVLYNGTGATQSITGVGFQPDLVWVKNRTGTQWHNLTDAVRGTNSQLYSNDAALQGTLTNALTSFDSDGFTVGSAGDWNGSGYSMVGWCWNAGGSTVTNTSGSITSSVRANQTSGFSVVTYTGTSANATVGHGLGVAPNMVICKSRGTAGTNWGVWHSSLTSYAYYLLLNTTAGQATAANAMQALPSSTLLSLGASSIFNDSAAMVAYCFAAVPGFSAFGSFSGTGSTDGAFVYTGFRPAFVMVKTFLNSTDNWYIDDVKRDTYNMAGLSLMPNLPNAQATSVGAAYSFRMDILSNGFKIRESYGTTVSFIYAAFAEFPFQFANAR